MFVANHLFTSLVAAEIAKDAERKIVLLRKNQKSARKIFSTTNVSARGRSGR